MTALKRKMSSGVGTTAVTIGGYVVPANVTATIIGMTVANVTSSEIGVSVRVKNQSGQTFYIVGGASAAIQGADVVPGGAIVIVGGMQKVILEAGDSVEVISSANNSADAIMSIAEIAN